MGSIIGLSVAGGVTVIGLIAFFIWKLTRKRFSDFDDGRQFNHKQHRSHFSYSSLKKAKLLNGLI